MVTFRNNFIKYIYSIILIFLAYHYFILGAKNINDKIYYRDYQEEKKVNNYFNHNAIQKNINFNLPKIYKNNAETTIRDEKELIIYSKINEIIVEKNQTFSYILNKQKIKNEIRQDLIDSIQKVYDLKKIKINQRILFYYQKNENNQNLLKKIQIPISYKEEIVLEKIENTYISKKINLPLHTEKKIYSVKIKNSLFQAGNKAGIPNTILIDLIRLYSFDVDFQRDIRVNDEFKIMYDVYYNDEKREVAYGDIFYCNLVLQRKELEYFLFENKDGKNYYNKDGKSVRKALMKTPIDGARLSSNFGMRKHPILGYNVKHRGVDFAASKGTPVYAAGNGTVEFVGRNGAYGKYIRIRHNNSYKTAYAHLNGYKKGIGKGVRVTQGETIGYVGSTGRSTGPHLHYEVIYNGKRINPMKMKLPSGKSLEGNDLVNYKKKISEILKFL